MPPSLTTYQKAAQSIYEPQKAAEQIALKSTHDTTVSSLEAEKGQVATDYQSAIDKLTQTVQDQTSQINQLYSQRLGGNFSGLQGNDLGGMFSRANEQQSIISQTRLNKLGQITAGETGADIAYNSGVASLAPKYQSMENEYAQNAYGGAVKDYNDTQYKNAQLQLAQQRLQVSASKASASASKPTPQAAKAGTVQNIMGGLSSVRGKDGYVSPQDYAQAYQDWLTSGYSASEFNSYFGKLKNPNNGYYDYAMGV